MNLYVIRTIRITVQPRVGFEFVLGANADDYIAHRPAPAQPGLEQKRAFEAGGPVRGGRRA